MQPQQLGPIYQVPQHMEESKCTKNRKCIIISGVCALIAIVLVVFLCIKFSTTKGLAYVLDSRYELPKPLKTQTGPHLLGGQTMSYERDPYSPTQQFAQVELQAKSEAEKYEYSKHGFEMVKNIPFEVLDEAKRYKTSKASLVGDRNLAKHVQDFLKERHYVDANQSLTCSMVMQIRESQGYTASDTSVPVIHYDFFDNHQNDQVTRTGFKLENIDGTIHSTINVWLPLNDERIKNNMLAFVPQEQFSDAEPFIAGVLAASLRKESLNDATFVYDDDFHWGHGWVFRTSSDSNEPLPMHASISIRRGEYFKRKSIEIRCALHD